MRCLWGGRVEEFSTFLLSDWVTELLLLLLFKGKGHGFLSPRHSNTKVPTARTRNRSCPGGEPRVRKTTPAEGWMLHLNATEVKALLGLTRIPLNSTQFFCLRIWIVPNHNPLHFYDFLIKRCKLVPFQRDNYSLFKIRKSWWEMFLHNKLQVA